MKIKFPLILLLTFIIMGCAPVKPYQKMYLNDQDMVLGGSELEYYDNTFQTYREGCAGANGGKVGGGCGCN